MKRILLAFIIVFLILLLKLLNRADCERVVIVKFVEKENYCIMFAKDGDIIIDKSCYYGERVVCGVRNGNVIFPYFTLLAG